MAQRHCLPLQHAQFSGTDTQYRAEQCQSTQWYQITCLASRHTGCSHVKGCVRVWRFGLYRCATGSVVLYLQTVRDDPPASSWRFARRVVDKNATHHPQRRRQDEEGGHRDQRNCENQLSCSHVDCRLQQLHVIHNHVLNVNSQNHAEQNYS